MQEQALVCYKFLEECNHKYLNSRYKYWDDIFEEIKTNNQKEFKDMCLRYWGINGDNSYKPYTYEKFKREQQKKYQEMFEEDSDKRKLWESMKKQSIFP
jgi:hypothetical protein